MNGYIYRYAQSVVTCAWPLDGLPRAAENSAEAISAGAKTSAHRITIDLLDTPPREPDAGEWRHHWPAHAGGLALALYRERAAYLLRFPELADVVISNDGDQVAVWPVSGTGLATLTHLVLDQVLPRCLAHRGRLVLHAGAVAVGEQAVAFVGATGRGKSTLTASLDAAGYPLLSDDALMMCEVDGCACAVPTYPSLRLWPDTIAGLYADTPVSESMAHYSTKRRIVQDRDAGPAKRLAAIVVLEAESATIASHRPSPSAACMAIISNSFLLDVADHHRAAAVLIEARDVAEHVPVFSIFYPRHFARLPQVHAAIFSLLERAERAPSAGVGKCTKAADLELNSWV